MVEALGIDLKEIIFAVANFLILLAVLTKFMYRPFLENLERRKQMIEDAI
ncbi:MAG: F0F1 ATP synthase subunit B, partial [Firmicutes bacterium]|nr:F0F1 ATP synthase subunit B [Bacillota bacterium]